MIPKEPPVHDHRDAGQPERRRLLITAGPTHEPIDAVRYLGNRSSGRLGIALADHAAAGGWLVTLLLGPTHLTPTDSRVQTVRFRTTADLQALLAEHLPRCDMLVMAAAVADYRPKPAGPAHAGKLRRGDTTLTLELEPTPDLLAECSRRRSQGGGGQTLVGFALEPRERLMESARSKLARKGLDFIVANPLETMDAPDIEATLLGADGSVRTTDGRITKDAFASWLLAALAPRAFSP
jgi:phosphopantothenoylcysteine decarboxylase / phosphopantothenate---cysteine ligase